MARPSANRRREVPPWHQRKCGCRESRQRGGPTSATCGESRESRKKHGSGLVVLDDIKKTGREPSFLPIPNLICSESKAPHTAPVGARSVGIFLTDEDRRGKEPFHLMSHQ